VLVPPGGAAREGKRPGWEHERYERMREKLSTGAGRKLYTLRKTTIEPVFGQVKYNRRVDRFMQRGRAAVNSELRLVAATHNLLKLHNHWIANTARPEAPRHRSADGSTEPQPRHETSLLPHFSTASDACDRRNWVSRRMNPRGIPAAAGHGLATSAVGHGVPSSRSEQKSRHRATRPYCAKRRGIDRDGVRGSCAAPR
jgi:Transposase DDE domain